ncbi:MAG TPA: AsmA family protein [Vicinamibacterales bacterium]|nr:AsmA family protein [Vicinamibacterales bacterium]
MGKKLLIALAAIVGVVILGAIAFALFFDINQFRPALAAQLGQTLGRRVEIGNLKVSWLAGGVAAEDVVILDDPVFSKEPFVSAKSVSIGVDLMPLVMSRSLHVESFTLDRPRVVLLRGSNGNWNFSSLAAGQSSSSSGSMGALSVVVQKITISGGQVTIGGLDGGRQQRSYDDVDVGVSDLSFTSRFPFKISAKTPGGGSINIDGQAGPFNLSDMAETPFSGTVAIAHLDFASTGFIDPRSGIGGVLDFSGTITSSGTAVATKGKATVAGLRLMPDASTSKAPIAIDYESSYNTKSESGTLKHVDVSIGKASARIAGDYRTSGTTSSVRMSLRGDKMALTELEGALPALGVTLPQGATLQQGTLDLDLAVSGPVDQLTVTGPLTASNVKMTGFDLGEKLGPIASVAQLAGLQRVGDTLVESLTGTLKMTPAGTEIDTIKMVAPTVGTLVGDGTISPQGALSFAMTVTFNAKPIGIPFKIQGTTKNPSFSPDMGRVVKNATESLENAAKNPDNIKKAADALSGLFGKKKP